MLFSKQARVGGSGSIVSRLLSPHLWARDKSAVSKKSPQSALCVHSSSGPEREQCPGHSGHKGRETPVAGRRGRNQKIGPRLPKGPFRTKNTTTIAKISNYYAVVFLLRPPNLLRRGPFLEKKHVCNSQENGVRTSCAAIVNHPAVLKILRIVNLLHVVFLVRRGPLGKRDGHKGTNANLNLRFPATICGFPNALFSRNMRESANIGVWARLVPLGLSP